MRQRATAAFLAALGLEGLLVMGLVLWLSLHNAARLPERIPLLIEITPPPAVKVVEALEPEKPRPLPAKPVEPQVLNRPLTPPVTPPVPPPVPPPVKPPTLAPVRPPEVGLPAPVDTPVTPAPTVAATAAPMAFPPSPVAQAAPHAVQAPPQSPPPPPPPTKAPAAVPVPAVQPAPAANADPSPAYKSQLTAAAQAAFQVPGTVAALNFKGRARVGFKLTGQTVSAIVLVQSSGLGAMDRAALAAVQNAQYPKAPAELRDREISFEIWVTHAPAN